MITEGCTDDGTARTPKGGFDSYYSVRYRKVYLAERLPLWFCQGRKRKIKHTVQGRLDNILHILQTYAFFFHRLLSLQ